MRTSCAKGYVWISFATFRLSHRRWFSSISGGHGRRKKKRKRSRDVGSIPKKTQHDTAWIENTRRSWPRRAHRKNKCLCQLRKQRRRRNPEQHQHQHQQQCQQLCHQHCQLQSIRWRSAGNDSTARTTTRAAPGKSGWCWQEQTELPVQVARISHGGRRCRISAIATSSYLVRPCQDWWRKIFC